jgi:hypothetical protein
MANDFLGQILGSVLGNANSGRQELPGGLGDLGGLGGALGNVFGRGPDAENEGVAARSPLGAGKARCWRCCFRWPCNGCSATAVSVRS